MTTCEPATVDTISADARLLTQHACALTPQQILRQLHEVTVVRVGHVELAARKLGVVRCVDTCSESACEAATPAAATGHAPSLRKHLPSS